MLFKVSALRLPLIKSFLNYLFDDSKKKSCFLPQYPPTNGLFKQMTTTAFPHLSRKKKIERERERERERREQTISKVKIRTEAYRRGRRQLGPSKCIVQYSQIRKNIRYGLLFPQNDDVTQTYVECESSNLSLPGQEENAELSNLDGGAHCGCCV